jgi:hypothetical protein
MKNTENDNLKQFHCSILIKDIKEKVEKLKEYGMSEAEIIAQLFSSRPLPHLTIGKTYRIYLGEERKEVHLEPLVKAVYLLFLNHPEGIMFKDLPDYRKELTTIYARLRPMGLTDRALQSIEDVTNPLLNSINEKCARIRKTLVSMLDGRTAEQYYIRGKRGSAKKIALPRELVAWE